MTEKTELNKSFVPDGQLDINSELHRQVSITLKAIHPIVLSMMDVKNITQMSRVQMATHIRPVIQEALTRTKIDYAKDQMQLIESRLVDEMTGLGPLEPLLQDDSVNDILVNAYDQVFVERFGELQPTTIQFWDEKHLLTIITRILSRINRRVDESQPYVNARLSDGSRVNVIVPPLSPRGPIVSIRKFKHEVFSLAEMVEQRSLTQQMANLLEIAVRSRLNIIVTGGTGSGKTTLLNAMAGAINPNERVITIEDICELKIQQPHYVQLEGRAPNIEGKGGISQRELFINSLRMRPDRIIVGEARGAEVFEMLQAMNVGHDGSLSTIHASAPEELPSRVLSMVSLTGFHYPVETVMRQFASCVDVIVEVQRLHNGRRVVSRICAVSGLAGDQVRMQDIFSFQYQHDATGDVLGTFQQTTTEIPFLTKAKRFGLEQALTKVMTNG